MFDFVDREKESRFLESAWNREGFQFIPIYGRRRIGKTRLIREFLKDKPGIYFLAQTVPEREQLKQLGRSVGQYFNDSILASHGFAEWDEFFNYITQHANERLALVIDEFPYLVNATRDIASRFQHAIDQAWNNTSLFLILMGSSIGMMEKAVLLHKAPLYGRRTGAMKVEEMPFHALKGFFPRKKAEDLIRIYGAAGAVPAYLERFNPKQGFWKSVASEILDRGSYLYDEVEFLLREELREPRNYFMILRAIAQGKRRLSEIINDTGFEKSSTAKYLVVLQDLQLVEREVPVTETNPAKSKRGLYRIRDKYFTFWFRFVFNNRARLEMGDPRGVLADIKKSYDQYLGFVFEDVCRDHCLVLLRKGEMRFNALGRWWDRQDEIDLVALDEENRTIYFGECRWRGRPVGVKLLDELRGKAAKVDWRRESREERYLLFSRSGFTPALKARSDVMLIGLDEMARETPWKKKPGRLEKNRLPREKQPYPTAWRPPPLLPTNHLA